MNEPEKKSLPLKPPGGTSYWLIPSIIIFIIVIYWSWSGMNYSFLDLFKPGKLTKLIYELTHPDFSPSIRTRVVKDMIVTVQTAFLGTLLAVIITFPLSFFAAFNVTGQSAAGRTVYFIFRTLFSLLRAIPSLIVAIYFVSVFGIGPFAGAMALAFHSIGQLGKLFAESIEQVEKGPIEAITALGGNKPKVVWYAILPQVYPQLIAYSIFTWDINIRMSMVIGLVGAGGIGLFIQEHMGLFQFEKVSTALIAILIVVLAFDLFSGWVRKKII